MRKNAQTPEEIQIVIDNLVRIHKEMRERFEREVAYNISSTEVLDIKTFSGRYVIQELLGRMADACNTALYEAAKVQTMNQVLNSGDKQ